MFSFMSVSLHLYNYSSRLLTYLPSSFPSIRGVCVKSLPLLPSLNDNHTCGLLLRPSPDRSEAAMVFSLPISTSMSDSVSPGHWILKIMLDFANQHTWISAPLIVVPVDCSECQVVKSIRAKIWVTPEKFYHLQSCFGSFPVTCHSPLLDWLNSSEKLLPLWTLKLRLSLQNLLTWVGKKGEWQEGNNLMGHCHCDLRTSSDWWWPFPPLPLG